MNGAAKAMQVDDSKIIEYLVWLIGGVGTLLTGIAIRIATKNYRDFTRMRRRLPAIPTREEYERLNAEMEAIKATIELGEKHVAIKTPGGTAWIIVPSSNQ